MNARLAILTRLTTDPTGATDGALLDAFLAGDQGAFALLVRRHAGLVFATCQRLLRHQHDAEDAFQATFLVLARRAADVWPREAVGSWLFGVAHRVALKARAVRVKRQSRETALVDFVSAEHPPPDFDLADVVHRTIAKLPDVYRAAVVACDLQGLSRKEAAAQLGWSEGTLSGRLARARGLLAVRLQRLGYSLPVGGVLAALGAPEVAAAALLQSTINVVTGTGGAASAPVVALTEGVVSSMALFKFKVAVATVFVACAVGFGALSASGGGAGDDQPTPAQKPSAPKSVDPFSKPAPPAKPASDLDPLQGEWRAVSIQEGDTIRVPDPKEQWVFEFSGSTLKVPYKDATGGWKQRDYKIAVDASKQPKTIDLILPAQPVGRAIYEFTAPAKACAECHRIGDRYKIPGQDWLPLCAPAVKQGLSDKHGLKLVLSIDGKRPTQFGGEGVIAFELKRPAVQTDDDELRKRFLRERYKQLAAELRREELDRKAIVELRRAEAEAELANARLQEAAASLEQSKAQYDHAKQQLKQAQDKLAEAKKAVADASKPQPAAPKDGPSFSVHVRTLTAAEKVIKVKATGKETVLEALVYAADDVPLMTATVSVWVVRGKEVLPVDLVGITQKGETKTNYVLKPGDQLFVQVKPGK